MNILGVLLRTKLWIIKASVFEKSVSSVVRNTTMVVFLSALLLSSYYFFHNLLFSYVINLEDIGYLLIERLISTGYLLFFFMLIISSFVTAISMLFRSRETEYLFSTPVPALVVFTGKYIDIIVFSSWAVLAMAMPILIAYANIRDFNAFELALTGVAIIFPYVIISTSIGTMIAILATYSARRVSYTIQTIILSLFFLALLTGMAYFSRPSEMIIPFTEDFRALNIFINNFRMNSHPLTPNFWLIQSLRALVHDNYPDFALYGGALVSSALFSLALMYYVAEAFFFTTWIETGQRTQSQGSISPSISVPFLDRAIGNQILSLIYKDLLVFLREPGQWSQLVLILALIVMYFFNLRLIPRDIEIEQWRTIISVMNFVFIGLVLATMTIRFLYTSFSLEGFSIWILGSAPLSPVTLFREKFWLSFIPFLLLAECIAYISGSLLHLEGLYYLLTIIGIFFMCTALTCLSIGLGAAFPDFSESNPARIASNPGGILTVVCSLIYIAIMTMCIGYSAYYYTVYVSSGGIFPMKSLITAGIIAVLLNIVTIALPLYLGVRAIEKREF